MFRSRTFVIGLGIGIIIGSLLLQLILESERQKEKSKIFEAEHTEAGGYTQAEVDRLLAEARDNLLSEAAASQQLRIGEVNEKPLIRIVRIPKGHSLEKTAEMLHDYGLIEDKFRFISSMFESSGKIRSGTFYFEGRPTEDDIRKTITNESILSFPAD